MDSQSQSWPFSSTASSSTSLFEGFGQAEAPRGSSNTNLPNLGLDIHGDSGAAPKKRAARTRASKTASRQESSPEAPANEVPSGAWLADAGQGQTKVERVAQHDAFARQAITDSLVDLIRERSTTDPLTIALFGEWGSGKTSQIGFVKAALGREIAAKPTVRIVDFNAWEHEKSENIAAALAQSIVEHLTAGLGLSDMWRLALKLSAKQRRYIFDALAAERTHINSKMGTFLHWMRPFVSHQSLLVVLFVLLFSQLDLSAAVKTLISTIAIAWAAVASVNKFVGGNLVVWAKRLATADGEGMFGLPDYSSKLGSFHDMRTSLQNLIELRIEGGSDPGKGEYLLIVVDDLDRCSTATIKQMLDAVRLVTSLPRVVTLVAMDDRIAFPAVETHFEQFKAADREPAMVARDYLAKVFNVSISLTPISPSNTRLFIEGGMFGTGPGIGGQWHPPERDEPEQTDRPGGGEIALVSQDEVRLFSELAAKTRLTNPRALWRLRQAWLILRRVARQIDHSEEKFAPWMTCMFVREAVKALPSRQRTGIEAWKDSGKPASASVDALAEIDPALRELLRSDTGGTPEQWKYADTVLLPAARGSA